ncbi:putative minor tail protein [Enterococcus mundtii QU 25]|uniref:tape measure protein n=2 Tax=Enterococcus TaxID=1350 RepID=UPI0003C56087|nr:tape measure protein [Enterococcus mundtii]BAO08046.1 putative minor tail protein [Enterococcus mundtii QU 25]
MSRSDGKVTIDIIVNGKQVTKEIDTVEQGFSRLGKNADDVMKKVGSDMGANTESGAKSANQAVDSVEKTVSGLGKTTESATAKAGKSIGDNFDTGAKDANQATDSVAKGVADLTATTSTELAKSGSIMGESFDSGAKNANQANDSVVKSVTSLVSSVESSAPTMGRSISETFLSAAKDSEASTDFITKSVNQMVSQVDLSATTAGKSIAENFDSGAKSSIAALDSVGKSGSSLLSSVESFSNKSGRAIAESFESGAKQANNATESIGKTASKMVPPVELSATKAGKSISESIKVGAKRGSSALGSAVDAMKGHLLALQEYADNTGSKLGDSFEKPNPSANLLTGSVGKLSAAMLITKGATTALTMAKGSLDGAFGRIDTLNNFENTMTRLTGSSEEAAAGMEGVRDVVVGTNYMLDSAAQTVQRLVMQNGSLEQSTKSYQIWGDAVAMYGDGAAETMDNVMDAMIQMRATGTVNMAQMDRMVRRGVDPWKIYEDATGMSMQSIRDALRDGEISANEFFDTVEQAMRDGGNEFTSVSGMAQQAGDTWAGSFANMATATSRGTANIIASMDEAFGKTRFGSMKENIQGFGKTFEGALNSIAGVIPPVVSAIDTMAGGVIAVKDAAVTSAPVIVGLGTAIGGLLIVQKAAVATASYVQMLKYLTGATSSATMAKKVDAVATKLGISLNLQNATATKAVVAANISNAASLKGAAAAQKTYAIAAGASAVAKKALAAASILLNPLVAGTAVALGLAGVAAAKMGIDFFAARKKAKELASELDGLKGDLDSVEKSTQSSAKEFESQAKVIESNTERNKDLAAELQRLSAIEDKSAADKKLMADTVDELNNSVTGLNLSYDEETGLLNATTEEINKRIEASKGMEEVNRLTERQKTLNQEAADIESSLTEVAKERMRLEQEASESGVDGKKKVKESLEGLSQKEDELQGLLVENQSERNQLYAEEQEKRRAVAETVSAANSQMITSWNVLSDAQQAALESMNSMYKKLVEESGNAFKQIEQQEAISLDQMKENLQKNAEAMRTWSTNVAILAKAGVDDGIIMQLEKLGPAGALQTQQMVDEMGLNLGSLAELGGEHTKSLLEQMGLHMEDLPKMSAEQSAWFVENLDLELGKLPETAQQHISDLNGTADATMKQAMASMANIVGEETETVAEKFGLVPEKSEASLRRGTEGRDFAQWGRQPVEEIGDGMVEATPKVEEAAKEVAQTPERVMGPQLEQTDYTSMGAAPPTKLGQGILDNITSVEEASKEVANVPEQTIRETVGIDKYISLGHPVGEGTSQGVREGKSQVESAAKEIAMVPENILNNEMTASNYNKNGQDVGAGSAKGIKDSQGAVQKAAKEIALVPGNEISTHMNQQEYQKHGEKVGKGTSQGITDTAPQAVSEINKMTEEMVKTSNEGSKKMQEVFEKLTKEIDKTLQSLPKIATVAMRESNQAYLEGMRGANDIIREGAQQMPNQMNHLPDQFYRIGQNSMIGLNNGLIAGQAQVLSTAASIANQVAQTMQRALDINSPSKVMEMDVGRWIPAGIGEGIERFKHLALDAIEDLGAQLVLPNIQAESVAIAGNAGFGRALPVSTNESRTTNQTIHNTPHIDIHFGEITIVDDRDIEELAKDLAQNTTDELRRTLRDV